MMANLHCWISLSFNGIAINKPDDRTWTDAERQVMETEVGATCMLSLNHEGPHEYTPDSEISVTFSEARDGEVLPL